MPKNNQPKLLSPKPDEASPRRRPFYQHPLFYVFLLVILATGIIFAVKHFAKTTPPPPPAPSTTQTSTSSSSTTTKPSSTDAPSTSSSDPSTSTDGKTPTQYDGADPNQNSAITGSLTTVRFNGDQLTIRVNIDQYLSSGTCSLLISDGAGKQIETSAPIIPSASTSTCEGFDLSAAALSGLSRPFNLTINLTSGDKTGTITGVAE